MFASSTVHVSADFSPETTGVVLSKAEEREEDEQPLVIPDVRSLAPALADLPTVEQAGQKRAVKDVMLEALSGSTAAELSHTRVDLRNVSLSALVGKAAKLPLLHRHPVRPVERKILDSITFSLLPFETTVMLGGPRSGKSSLLDVIAGRRDQGVTGEITVNGALESGFRSCC